MIKKDGVRVIAKRASKLVQALMTAAGHPPLRPHWNVMHWNKFKHIAYTEEEAQAYAAELRKKLERERVMRDIARSDTRAHNAYLARLSKQILPFPMQKTNINPACYQPFLESASNAGEKGQAQFLTPVEWAEVLAQPLPRYRPVMVDLHCGGGHLLHGAARASTNHFLGCDIDPTPARCPGYGGGARVIADVCKLFPLMRAVEFIADCFVLNPPWDLHQYRAPIAGLAESWLPTVRAAFAAHDGRTGKDTIDSTIVALLLALDRSSLCGEGFLVANESTLQRLLFVEGAPHIALASHIWAHLVIRGNPMTGLDGSEHEAGEFHTGVIYFAAGHEDGLPPSGGLLATIAQPAPVANLEGARVACKALYDKRLELRNGPEIKTYAHTEDSAEKWQALTEEWNRTHLSGADPLWNISLGPDDTIATNLSLFDTKSSRVTKAEAESLFSLNGRQPMQLVMQRQQRGHLERAAFGDGRVQTPWRVDPRLQAAVRSAVEEYHKVRSPLYPLSPIQRLGYLDECDTILCTKDLCAEGGQRLFKADRSYALRSTTIAVNRSGTKLNLQGEADDVEWDGQELAFYIADEFTTERVFMDARLRAENVRLSILRPGEKPGEARRPARRSASEGGSFGAKAGRQDERNLETCAIDFTLQDLVHNFVIPDVPDVARVNPGGYLENLALLKQIEALCP